MHHLLDENESQDYILVNPGLEGIILDVVHDQGDLRPAHSRPPFIGPGIKAKGKLISLWRFICNSYLSLREVPSFANLSLMPVTGRGMFAPIKLVVESIILIHVVNPISEHLFAISYKNPQLRFCSKVLHFGNTTKGKLKVLDGLEKLFL